jgi:hypothetical protein
MNAKPKKSNTEDQPMETITVDGTKYKLNELSDPAKSQISNIQFVDLQIRQLQNEWAIADTARLGYQAALNAGLKKLPKNSQSNGK